MTSHQVANAVKQVRERGMSYQAQTVLAVALLMVTMVFLGVVAYYWAVI